MENNEKTKEILASIKQEIFNRVKESGTKSEQEVRDIAETCLIENMSESGIDKVIVKKEGDAYFVDFKLKDNEAGLIIAMCGDGLNLKNVPPDRVTQAICWSAVRQNYTALRYVPREFRTPGLIQDAINGFLTDMSVYEGDDENCEFKLSVRVIYEKIK